jgi:GTP-binding protein EngB required for normal cell division
MARTFTLLSIGQRGVGKTVFLAGSYVQLYNSQDRTQPLWFECKDSASFANIEKLLEYMARTGQYPPATLAINQFHFNLKRRTVFGPRTLCHFRWQDVPGEICNYDNPIHKQLVWQSHGCCLFLDAPALLRQKEYVESTAEAWEQVQAYAYLTSMNRLSYPFAIILTKCDLLKPEQLQRPLDQALRPLTAELRRLRADWKVFRSSVILQRANGRPGISIEATGPEPLVWLVSEIARSQRVGWFGELRDWWSDLFATSSSLSETGTVAQALTPLSWKRHTPLDTTPGPRP